MGKLRQVGEIALTKLGLAVVPRLSRRAVLRLASSLGSAAYVFSRHLRRVGLANLGLVYGDRKTLEERKSILRSSFRSFALTILDLFWFAERPDRLGEFVHFDTSYEQLKADEPSILLTAHMGNWEVGGRASLLSGIPLASVAAQLANPAVDELFNRIRRDSGQEVIFKKGALRRLVKTLRDNGVVALLLDQNTKPSKGGIFVDFFGLPVPIATSVAGLALQTGAKIYYSNCLPDDTGHYHCCALRPISVPPRDSGEKDELIRRLTEDIARVMEEDILTHPGYWLWTYKRWKYVAPGKSREDYPFYAKELLPLDMKALEKERS